MRPSFISGLGVALAILMQPAVAQQGTGIKWLRWDESKRARPLEVFDPLQPGERYRLSEVNRTVAVWRAYKTDSLVVILGEMDGDIGEIVTAIDAGSRQEKMEFLCYDAQPSDSGLKIAFRHFLPHFGTAEISDRVQILDLSHGAPALSPSADFHVPPEDAGITVYPPTPLEDGQKHRIQNFLWGNGESSLFFVDRLERVQPGRVEETGLCLVRWIKSPPPHGLFGTA